MSAEKTSGILEKTFKCAAALGANLLVKMGADDDHVVVATAVGDAIIGVSEHSTTAAEQAVRVQMLGIAEVKLGGTVTRGGLITTNATGQGVAAAPAAGVNNSVIGRVTKSGVINDIAPVFLAPGQIQGA